MKMGPQDTVWITGAAGRMGQAIEHFLDHSRYKVMTSDIEIDVSNLHEVLNFAESYRPDFVINCAALASRTEADENPDKAYKVNALGARNLAIASNNVGATMVHLSTDDLFPENADRAFNEFDTTNPPHVYGKSQAGRRALRQRAEPAPHHRALQLGLHRPPRRPARPRAAGKRPGQNGARAREPVRLPHVG